MKIYLAGPMRGIPFFNYPAFDEAAAHLRSLGHSVFSPADHDRAAYGDITSESGELAEAEGKGFSIRDALAWDTNYIAREADAVAVLPNWEDSKGATAEVALARALGLPVSNYRYFNADDAPGAFTDWELDLMTRLDDAAEPLASAPSSGEVRVTSSTGGQKGQKLARYDLLPAKPLRTVAELYGHGAEKYAARNWELGYDWSLSFAALNRHLWQFWDGEDVDSETGMPHLASVVFHAFGLLEFAVTHPNFDDRPSTLQYREALKAHLGGTRPARAVLEQYVVKADA